jgi:hypothetical protein
MERAHQLSELAGLIATIRAKGQAVRLVLHHTERFGLIHLYFAEGRLVRVEGHAGNPTRSLLDLRTWRYGAIRVDHIAAQASLTAEGDALETVLSQTLAELERRGVIHPAPPAVTPQATWHARGMSGRPQGTSGQASIDGLPTMALPLLPELRHPSMVGAIPVLASGESLTDPQWQLLALAIRQVTDQAGQLIGSQVAQGMLRQALAQTATGNPFLAGLDIDATGWVHPHEAGFATRFSTYDVAEAVAALLTGFESLCAELLGAVRAQQMIAAATGPLRTSLEQIGISVRGE